MLFILGFTEQYGKYAAKAISWFHVPNKTNCYNGVTWSGSHEGGGSFRSRRTKSEVYCLDKLWFEWEFKLTLLLSSAYWDWYCGIDGWVKLLIRDVIFVCDDVWLQLYWWQTWGTCVEALEIQQPIIVSCQRTNFWPFQSLSASRKSQLLKLESWDHYLLQNVIADLRRLKTPRRGQQNGWH